MALGLLSALALAAELPLEAELTELIDSHWATERYRDRVETVRGFPIPLGKMKKIRGSWQLEHSEPVSGELERTTWQVRGEPVQVLFDEAFAVLKDRATLVWSCNNRGCGNASEWASRVYQERLLYGRDEYQNYAAFRTEAGEWLTLFSAARTTDRQYLHLDRIAPAN